LLNDDSDQNTPPTGTGSKFDIGPKTEFAFWRNRMQKITNWSE